jgi:SAM-dependent methyltransferase
MIKYFVRMSQTPRQDAWSKLYNKSASDYERQSAGATRQISQQVLALLSLITSSSVIHDNACGPGMYSSHCDQLRRKLLFQEKITNYSLFNFPGIVTTDVLTQSFKSGTESPVIHATDFNQGMLTALQAIIDEKNLKTVTARVMDESDLSEFEDDTFTHSITNFGIFTFPDPVAGAAHIRRTLKPGGIAAITTWKHPGNIFFINAVLQALAPGSPEWFPLKKGWLEESHFRGILEKAGFQKEKIEVIEKRALWKIDDLEYTVSLFDGPFWDNAKAGLNVEQKGRFKNAVKNTLKSRNGRGIDIIA